MVTSTTLGRVGLEPRGEYDPSAQYTYLNLVRYEGSGYLVLRPIQGVTPVDGDDYMLLAQAGSPGEPGADGEDGSSISSIERTDGNGAPGTVDTYTVTLTDGRTSTFQVYNGKDGQGSGDMTKSVYDPQNKAQDIFQYVDDALQDIPAAENAVTVPGGAAITMGEGIGAGGYQFKFTPEGDEPELTASDVGYDNTGSGLAATTVQGAVDEVAGKLAAGQVYSTEEVRIGTWLGKPLYSKTYVMTTPTEVNVRTSVVSDATTASILHCPSITGFVAYPTADIPLNFYLPLSGGVSHITTWFRLGSIDMVVTSEYAGRPFEMTIEYTKTTDAAEST